MSAQQIEIRGVLGRSKLFVRHEPGAPVVGLRISTADYNVDIVVNREDLLAALGASGALEGAQS